MRTLDGVPDQLRFHDLRHAFATQLSVGGVPFKEITALLGQSSPGETERSVMANDWLAGEYRRAAELIEADTAAVAEMLAVQTVAVR